MQTPNSYLRASRLKAVVTPALFILLGFGLAASLIFWGFKVGRLVIHEHPSPPMQFEPRSSAVPSGALTALYPLVFEQIEVPFDDALGRGGAFFVGPQATYFMARDGSVFQVEDDRLLSISIHSPFRLETSAKRTKQISDKWFLGVKDAGMVKIDGRWTLVVSYLDTHPQRDCLRIVVVSHSFEGRPFEKESGYDWKPVFKSKSCQKAGKTLISAGAGGAMHVQGSRVFVSVGDIGLDLDATRQGLANGTATPANQPSGTIFEIDFGASEPMPFARGFRNVSGIIQGSEDTLWTIEHGPRGGDELNRVARSEFFGWPLSTLGTEYTGFEWLGSYQTSRHESYKKPVFSWTPAIGPSALLRISGKHFTRWAGDIVVSSLKAGRLYRIQFDDERVMLVEPIYVGHRIRDIVEGHDGALYLFLERKGLVLRISVGQREKQTEELSSLVFCASCHQLKTGETGEFSGPPLVGIVGRKIASVPGYGYSPALSGVDGAWNTQNLDLFLENPEVFGAGGTMPNPMMSYSQRRKVIKALEELDSASRGNQ